jgi:molecular chaperone DnaK (HSP70)
MKAGLPLVEVMFRVDANGILTVSAIEKRSGKKAEIEVIPFHGLTQFEIERIMEDSFEHAVDDFNERQLGPRLSDFTQKYPDIALRVEPINTIADLQNPILDMTVF